MISIANNIQIANISTYWQVASAMKSNSLEIPLKSSAQSDQVKSSIGAS